MASTRVTVIALTLLPALVPLALFLWAVVDILDIPLTGYRDDAFLAILVALAATLVGLRTGYGPVRRFGLGLLVATYLGVHLILLPLDAAPSLGFLTLALFAAELRIVADRFAPLYAAPLAGDDRERVGSALQRSLVRVIAVSGVAFLGSTLAADLALAGTVPVTTIPTALVLAAALVGVIFVLALWPILERRES